MSKRVVGLSLFLLIAFGVITFLLLSKDALQTGICPGGLTPYDCPGIESPVCGVLCDDDRMPFNCTTLKCECEEGVNYELPCPENPLDVCLQNADCYYGTRRNCKEDLGHASDCSVCEDSEFNLYFEQGEYFCMPSCLGNKESAYNTILNESGDGEKVTIEIKGETYAFSPLSPFRNSSNDKDNAQGGYCGCFGDLVEIQSESCSEAQWCGTPLTIGKEWVCKDDGNGNMIPSDIQCAESYTQCAETPDHLVCFSLTSFTSCRSV